MTSRIALCFAASASLLLVRCVPPAADRDQLATFEGVYPSPSVVPPAAGGEVVAAPVGMSEGAVTPASANAAAAVDVMVGVDVETAAPSGPVALPPLPQIRAAIEPRDIPRRALPSAPAPAPRAPTPDVGPDLTRCAAPLPADAPDVTYFCECAVGADPDCVPGDDANPGSAAAPKRSFAAAMSSLEVSGGIAALCRGGAFRATEHRLTGAACSVNSPCVLADYAAGWSSGDELRPVVSSELTENGYLYGVDAAGDHPVAGFEIRNLRFDSAYGWGAGVFLFRNVSDVRMSCLDVTNFDIGVQAATVGARVVFEDGAVHDNGHQGFMGGCSECGVRRSSFVNNGHELASSGGAAFAHNVYFGAGDGAADGMFVESSYIARAAVRDSDGKCGGTSLNVHGGRLSNLRIVGNVVEEPRGGADAGCWGIAVDSAASGYEENSDVRIAGNVVRNVGNVAIGLASCIRCTVESNVVVQEHIGGATGIAMPNRQRSAEDAASDDFVARNNTVYYSGDGDGVGLMVGGEGDGHVVTNNVVAFEGRAGTCFGFDLPASAYAVQANLCSGGTFDQGTTGLDSDPSTLDPHFVDPPVDLRVRADSPVVDTGTRMSASADGLLGTGRGDRPDRGAYER